MRNYADALLFVVDIKISPGLVWFISLTHLAALLSLVTCQLSFWTYITLSGFLILSWGHCLVIYGTYHSHFINRVNPLIHLNWCIQLANRETVVATLTGGYVHPYLVILHFRRGWRIFSVVLPMDAMDKETFRRLRARLRWQRWNYHEAPDHTL